MRIRTYLFGVFLVGVAHSFGPGGFSPELALGIAKLLLASLVIALVVLSPLFAWVARRMRRD